MSSYAIGAVQTLLWIFQSRIYENGRPSVQECVIASILSALYLFAGGWQLYQTFANSSPTEFICDTDTSDMTLHCRLWQTQVVGSATCGVMFFLAAIFFILLFRSRPMVIKDLPDDIITSSPIMSPANTKRNDIELEAAAAAAEVEAERRRREYREQQQQQQHRPYQQQHAYQQQQQQQANPYQQQANPYQQQHYQTKRVVPGQLYNQNSSSHLLHHQNSSGFINQQQQQQPATPSPRQDHTSRVSESDNYYNSGYAGQRQNTSFEMTQPNTTAGYVIKAPLVTPNANGGYTEEPTTYMDASGATNAQHQDFPAYAYGHFDPSETFDDPTSQEALSHLAYANQLREQQLYHQNMGEFLQKQSQQRVLKQQQQQDRLPPASGSTVDFYPPPPRQNTNQWPASSAPPPSSSFSGKATLGSRDSEYAPYTTTATQNFNTGMVTPGSMSGGPRISSSPRITGSPQLRYPDDVTVAESTYSDDRHKGILVDEIRKARMEERQTSTPVEDQELHDYKVQVSTSPRVHNPNYIPPPMGRA
ncbi:hypothetical protein BGZ76_005996 [Entomortierella beljakovae]|nr:hypothetical protein BGZ76_005996 [Entomortierella beljakovae]